MLAGLGRITPRPGIHNYAVLSTHSSECTPNQVITETPLVNKGRRPFGKFTLRSDPTPEAPATTWYRIWKFRSPCHHKERAKTMPAAALVGQTRDKLQQYWCRLAATANSFNPTTEHNNGVIAPLHNANTLATSMKTKSPPCRETLNRA